MSDLPRYLPEQAWPAYAYLPGRHPHPTRDPKGHSRGVPENLQPAEQPADWPESVRYLRGIDLYNHGYGWEAHEVWESMWHRPAEAAQAEWLQALIQLAAATVQELIGHPDGRARLCDRALDHLGHVREEGHRVYMGLELEQLRHALRAYAVDPGQRPVLRLHRESS